MKFSSFFTKPVSQPVSNWAPSSRLNHARYKCCEWSSRNKRHWWLYLKKPWSVRWTSCDWLKQSDWPNRDWTVSSNSTEPSHQEREKIERKKHGLALKILNVNMECAGKGVCPDSNLSLQKPVAWETLSCWFLKSSWSRRSCRLAGRE